MKGILFSLFLLSFSTIGKSQNIDSIYLFMNNDLPKQGLESSNWGMFFLADPYPISEHICEKLKAHSWTNTPVNIQNEFLQKCADTNKDPQESFKWSQLKMSQYIIVKDTKHKLSNQSISDLPIRLHLKREMIEWINEWNKTKPNDRLVNYASVPLFSSDKKFVLMVRGQDVENEGGWDTIFIYKLNGHKWEVAEKIIVATI